MSTAAQTSTSPPRPWLMLGLSAGAQVVVGMIVSIPAYLIPLLHTQRGLSLAEAGAVASAPSIGMLVALLGWGLVTDRVGERPVIILGLGVVAVGCVAAMFVTGAVGLAIAFGVTGIGCAATGPAGARVVVGWFPPERRGRAMGVRQVAFPVGTGIGALTIPALTVTGDIAPALLVSIALTVVAAVACGLFIREPPLHRDSPVPVESGNPYRGDARLVRIHVLSALLFIPQQVLTTFGLVWLVADQLWDPIVAGVLIAVTQFLGAGGRVGIGILSDRVRSHLRPVRWIAIAGGPLLLLTALGGALHWHVAVVVLFALASCVSVADNAPAFTAVAEISGSGWSGRALGIQSTGQLVLAAVLIPAVGALIGLVGYAASFAVVALAPIAAIPLVPKEPSAAD